MVKQSIKLKKGGRIVNVKASSDDKKGKNINIADAPIFQGEEAKQFNENSPYYYTLHYDWEGKMRKPADAIISKTDNHYWITKGTFDDGMDRQTYRTIRDILLQNGTEEQNKARKSAEIKQENWRRGNSEIIDKARIEREKQMQADRNNPFKNEGFWSDFRDGFVDTFTKSLDVGSEALGALGLGEVAQPLKMVSEGTKTIDALTRGGNLIKTKTPNGWKCEKCNKTVKNWNTHIKTPEHGAGLWKWVKQAYNNVKDKFYKRLDGFNNTSTATLKTYGNYPITSLRLFKKPINSMLDKVINLISLNKWDELKKTYDFDKLYHLGALASLNVNGKHKTVQFEKVQAVKFYDGQNISGSDVEYLDVPINENITLNQMTEKARQAVGDKKYFDYSGLGMNGQPPNNCQYFIKYNLEDGLGIWNSEINDFVMQDLTDLSEKMPTVSKKIMNTITDAGMIADNIMGGNLTIHRVNVNKNVPFEQALKHAQNILKTKRKFKQKEVGNNWHFRAIPKTKFKPRSWKSKKINDDITLVFGQLKD